MSTHEIQDLKEKLTFPENKGFVPMKFKGKKYKVQCEVSGGDTTLLSIKPL
jgi:hypothetical protein